MQICVPYGETCMFYVSTHFGLYSTNIYFMHLDYIIWNVSTYRPQVLLEAGLMGGLTRFILYNLNSLYLFRVMFSKSF